MIVVTRLNQSHFAVNPDLVERIHENPDTTLVLVDGTTFIVTETMSEVIDKIAAYRARVIQLASRPADYPIHGIRHLEAVPDEQPWEPREPRKN
ncbi:flagellar FlbD family protein [Glaciibacter psychrotolerans]|uniref:Flagellar protein FlbD n=1 Tax=Glaciibacter psychrotolerans TaxID=670054 RepID=A0A7Z0ED70_9MICO|nr:flagellar FlbD family protein [Leifsonia psychrotolerans]NYJ18767.1 flagellar protein FlbD [Leifsonia psychrotolerans]